MHSQVRHDLVEPITLRSSIALNLFVPENLL
jgi:hypothetical protein